MAPLDPPPEAIYDSPEVAEAHIQQWAEAHGYATVRKNHSKDKFGEMRKIWVICDKGGKIRRVEPLNSGGTQPQQDNEDRDGRDDDTQRRTKPKKTRKAGSRKTGCEFQLAITRTPDREWAVEVLKDAHNHEPSDHPSAHPSHRKLTQDEENLLKSMADRAAKPRDILLAMKQLNPHSHIKARDIRNQKAKLREEELGGRTSTEALLELLMESDNWATSWAKDPNTNRLNRLLFCNHMGIELAQNRPEILLIDATYKTNQFNMPLLHFAGVYPSNSRKGTSFSIGFCFLPSEEETTYQWAVREFQKAVYGDRFKPTIIVTDNDTGLRNSISTVWPSVPSLLCRWHINKNVLTKAQETWRVNGLDEEERKRNGSLRDAFMERWINVTYSKTKESFEEAYRQLKNDYSEQPALLEYLDEFKYSTKELYVEAYTSEFKHYGVTVTSRIEGGHSCLKKFLGTSKSDLFGVVKVISMLHTEQYDKIRDELAQSRDLIAHDINAKLPANTWMDPGINRKVVPLGLKKLRQQYELTLKPAFNQGCSGTFEKTMGIPCSHTISHLIEVNLKVSAAHFDAFWLYDRPVPAPPVPDPLHDVPAQFGMIDLTNIDPLLPDPAEIHIPPPPPAQFGMIDLTNIDPLLPDPADVPPLPPAVLPPLKVRAKGRPRKDDTSTKRQPSAWERNGGPRSSAVSFNSILY